MVEKKKRVRKLSKEKAAEKISSLLGTGEFTTVAAVVKAHPELAHGADAFNAASATPASQGSGSVLTEWGR